MTATIPLGRRRLVLTIAAEPFRSRSHRPDPTIEASDAELARLATRRFQPEQARWDAWAALHGVRW